HRTHLFHVDNLLAKVVEIEFPLSEFFLLAASLLLVDSRLGRLNQTHNVAHTQDLADQALRVKRLQLVELLSLADKLDRHSGDPAHRKRRPTSSIAIELG